VSGGEEEKKKGKLVFCLAALHTEVPDKPGTDGTFPGILFRADGPPWTRSLFFLCPSRNSVW
jgi:hypothetical protein